MLSGLVALVCVAVSWRTWRALPAADAERTAIRELASRRVPTAPAWVARVLEHERPEQAAAELREQLLELKLRLDGRRRVRAGTTRVALTAGTALAVLGLALGLGKPDAGTELWSLGAFVMGALGASVCAWVGHQAEQRVSATRAAYVELAAVLRTRLREESLERSPPESADPSR